MAAYDRREFAGAAKKTTLAADISAVALAFTVADATGYPTGAGGNFIMTLDRGKSGEERILCSARAANAFTVVAGGRGYDGTAATAHSAGIDVEHTSGKQDFDEANKAVSETIAKVTTAGDILVATGANAMQRKGVGTDGFPLVARSSDPAKVAYEQLTAAAIAAGAISLAKLAADVTDLVFGIGDVKWQTHDTPMSARWQIADGAAISRAAFAALFALVGTAYGVGDGVTTFNKPNLVDSLPLGAANNAARAQKAAGLSHPHAKAGAITAANATHNHGGNSGSGSPGNHDHNTFDGANPSVTGGTNQSLAHTHAVGADNANHGHGDNITVTDGTAGNVTKLVPMIRVA